MIALLVVEVVTLIFDYNTEYCDFIDQTLTPNLVKTMILRIDEFDQNFKSTICNMFLIFFDRFINDTYAVWCASSPILDLAIEDITNEPDFSTEMMLVNLLEALFTQIHLTTKEQRLKIGEF